LKFNRACFDDSVNADTINITDTGLTLTDVSTVGSLPVTYQITFAPGLLSSVAELADNFPVGAVPSASSAMF
jgi:hypothetical protein